MDPRLTTFAIPTYRLRDVGETIERYDENFWRNGKATRLVVFDDSTQATHQIQGALALWPTLVEICYFHKHTRDLPMRKVRNVRLDPGSSSGR